jgi:hypothetical protein
MEVEKSEGDVERIELESSNMMVGWGCFLEEKKKHTRLIAWFVYRVHAVGFRKNVIVGDDCATEFVPGERIRSRILPVVIVNDEVLYDPEGNDDTVIPKLRKVAAVPPWVKWHYGPSLVHEG